MLNARIQLVATVTVSLYCIDTIPTIHSYTLFCGFALQHVDVNTPSKIQYIANIFRKKSINKKNILLK